MADREECKHIMGIYESYVNGKVTIIEKDYNCYLLTKNAKGILTRFKYCPECGKKLI